MNMTLGTTTSEASFTLMTRLHPRLLCKSFRQSLLTLWNGLPLLWSIKLTLQTWKTI